MGYTKDEGRAGEGSKGEQEEGGAVGDRFVLAEW